MHNIKIYKILNLEKIFISLGKDITKIHFEFVNEKNPYPMFLLNYFLNFNIFQNGILLIFMCVFYIAKI